MKKSKFTHGAFYGGISGFGLAASWCGIETLWHSEIESYPRKLLKQNFPRAKLFGDIRRLKSEKMARVDIISAGVPCQCFSNSGQKRGVEDDRYLWPETIKLIEELGPRWVIVENVPAIRGMVLGDWIADLASSGYSRIQVFNIPAVSLSAKHLRERIWIVVPNDEILNEWKYNSREGASNEEESRERSGEANVRDTYGELLQQSKQWSDEQKRSFYASKFSTSEHPDSVRFQEQWERITAEEKLAAAKRRGGWFRRKVLEPIICRVPYGISSRIYRAKRSWRDPSYYPGVWADGTWEKGIPRTTKTAKESPNRKPRLKGLGNAIVPQLAYEIFRNILLVEEYYESDV